MTVRLLPLLSFGLSMSGAVLSVGPGKSYDKPCAAIRVASPGDTIEIDAAGDYAGDVCGWTTSGLTLRGVGGRPKIDAAGRSAQSKAIWVITGNDTLVENIEFSGAAVPDRNGAGIRQEGRNLTVRDCYFHNNEAGILAGDSAGSEIVVEYTEFAGNGAGDGFSHNIYVNHVARFVMRFCYSHHALRGHLVKSRAAENQILYNRLTDESTGETSYEIDLPNGGRSFIIGNMIEQGPRTENSTIIAFREEGAHPANPDSSLFVVNNTIVNNRSAGIFLGIAAATPTPAVVRNNIFIGPGTLITQASAVLENNLLNVDARFRDAARYDFRLNSDSPAIDAGIDPGLEISGQYVHSACGEGRLVSGVIDIGAYEFNGSGFDAAAPARCRRIESGGIVNAANFLPGPVAPGSLMAIFGSNLAAESFAAVTINQLVAPVAFASPQMIVAQVPYEAEPGMASATVKVEGTSTESATFSIAPAAPAIFVAGNASAVTGGTVVVSLTGIGLVQPAIATGEPAPADVELRPVLQARATIGGQAAEITSLRLAPGLIGVAQAEIAVPAALSAGDYPLVVTVGDGVSAPVMIAVAN